MRLSDIQVGADYACTLPRQLPLTDAEHWELDQSGHPLKSLAYDALFRYHFPPGQHHEYGFRVTVIGKGVPAGKTNQGVVIQFTYRAGFGEDAPTATDLRTIHASRVKEPWEDFEARQLRRAMDFLERHPTSRYGCNFPGCPEVYEHPRILGPLGRLWYCPAHDLGQVIPEEDAP